MAETTVAGSIASRIAEVRQRIDDAAREAGRSGTDVTLVAVAKWQSTDSLRVLRAAGIRDIGENYAQELAAKATEIDDVRWHFVGRLQRNKVGLIIATDALVHSLDSLELAQALGRRAIASGRTARALVQVEVDNRPAAHGVPASQLPEFLDACHDIDGLKIRGLMLMPAQTDPDNTRRAYAAIAALRQGLPELSMGMSRDMEAAVAEGATMVRIGTAIFGQRPLR